MDYYMYLNKVIEQIVDGITADKKDKLVLYPFGQQGMLVKQILNWRYGIKEAFILDAFLCEKNNDIKALDYLREIDTTQYVFLITSDNLDYWDQIRRNLKKYVKEKNIIDLFYDKPFRYNTPRVASLEMAAREIYEKQIDGAVAEAGCYKGEFARFINEFFPDRPIYLFDTFEGFSSKDIVKERQEGYTLRNSGHFGDTSEEIVLQKMPYRSNVIVKKGWFPDTAIGLDEKYCFVSLDMDLYQPILAGLEYFFPRLSLGGYIFVHDCNIGNSYYRGARQALLEFIQKVKIGYVMLPDNRTAVITK